MFNAKELLEIKDELNLYLVANKLKPASIIYINPESPKLKNRVFVNEEIRDSVNYTIYRLNQKDIEEFRHSLDNIDVPYKDWEDELVSFTRNYNEIVSNRLIIKGQKFFIGSNQENLERLISAKEDNEIGYALGFPKESINAYQKIIDGERRDGAYVSVSIARAKKSGLELPTWLAYICFVPENLDFINNKVSSSTKELARKHQEFVRDKNPELAKRVEQSFLKIEYPVSWEKMKNSSYSIRYKFNDIN